MRAKCYGQIVVEVGIDWGKLRSDVIAHDLSKLSYVEFVQYRDSFYPVSDQTAAEIEITKFFMSNAWEHHKLMNKHHHEVVSTCTDVVHMVIDWLAMSYKFGDSPEEYYEKYAEDIHLKPKFELLMCEIFDMLR